MGIEAAAAAVFRVAEQVFFERAVHAPDAGPLRGYVALHHPKLILAVHGEIHGHPGAACEPIRVVRPHDASAGRADRPQRLARRVEDADHALIFRAVENEEFPGPAKRDRRGLSHVERQWHVPAPFDVHLHDLAIGDAVERAVRREGEVAVGI